VGDLRPTHRRRQADSGIEVRHGRLPLATLALEHEGGGQVAVKLGDASLPATLRRDGKRILITLNAPVEITAGNKLEINAG
jgi:hypothetical protein